MSSTEDRIMIVSLSFFSFSCLLLFGVWNYGRWFIRGNMNQQFRLYSKRKKFIQVSKVIFISNYAIIFLLNNHSNKERKIDIQMIC